MTPMVLQISSILLLSSAYSKRAIASLPDVSSLLRSPTLSSPCSCRRKSCLSTLTDQVGLELGRVPKTWKMGLPPWGHGVNLLGEGAKADAPLTEQGQRLAERRVQATRVFLLCFMNGYPQSGFFMGGKFPYG